MHHYKDEICNFNYAEFKSLNNCTERPITYDWQSCRIYHACSTTQQFQFRKCSILATETSVWNNMVSSTTVGKTS